MTRALPLRHATALDSTADERVFSGTVAVFDPAMCCATGVCGPGVDPALLQIARDLRWLEAKGITVQRVGLGQEPQAFVANRKVAGLMQAFGGGALPAVLVNDAVLVYGRYPTRDELLGALAPAKESVHAKPTASESGNAATAAASDCCTPGTECC